MKDKIIMDRTYAFYLIDYLGKMERKPSISFLYDGNHRNMSDYTMNAINSASILFKKILIEDYYGSSLQNLTRKHEWFWELFEIYSPEEIASGDPEFSLIVDDSVRLDLQDKKLRAVIRKNLPHEYSKEEKLSSLLWNTNRTLQAAKSLDSAILPWPHKVHVYDYKFANTLTFQQESKSYRVLRTILDFQVPSFSIDTLEDLVMLRSDPRISSLRKLIWDLTDAEDTETKESILQRIEEEKAKLVKCLAPSSKGFIRSLVSSPIPFPFSIAIEGLYQLADLQKIRPYAWYFLLMDLRDFHRSSPREN